MTVLWCATLLLDGCQFGILDVLGTHIPFKSDFMRDSKRLAKYGFAREGERTTELSWILWIQYGRLSSESKKCMCYSHQYLGLPTKSTQGPAPANYRWIAAHILLIFRLCRPQSEVASPLQEVSGRTWDWQSCYKEKVYIALSHAKTARPFFWTHSIS